MFHLEVLAERLPLTFIFQIITFIHYVQRLANVTKTAKFNLPSISIILKVKDIMKFEKENKTPNLLRNETYLHDIN